MSESGADEVSQGIARASSAESWIGWEQPNASIPATCATGSGNIGDPPYTNPEHFCFKRFLGTSFGVSRGIARKRLPKVLSDLALCLEFSSCYGGFLRGFLVMGSDVWRGFCFGLVCFDALCVFVMYQGKTVAAFGFVFVFFSSAICFFLFFWGRPGSFFSSFLLCACRTKPLRSRSGIALCVSLSCVFLLSLPGSAPPLRLSFLTFCVFFSCFLSPSLSLSFVFPMKQKQN